jgi:hypothetical protein
LGSIYGVVAEHPLLFPFVQSALHPSPSTLFASSHCSVPITIPSPQYGEHTPFTGVYPVSQLVQELTEIGQTKHKVSVHTAVSQLSVTEL